MSYQAIYDATLQALDISYVKAQAHDAISSIENDLRRPSVLFRPRLMVDGNQWVALYGDNLQEGVVGVGDSPDAATWDFDRAWNARLEKASSP